jgi:4-hydroxybenzoate polyprenyltransferase
MKGIHHNALKFYSFLRLLSVDIVFGALCGSYFASKIFDVTPSFYFWITLVSTVWIIYTADHILDGIRTREKFVSETYQFHYRYKNLLILVCSTVAVITSLIVFFFLEKGIVIFGLCTLVLVMVYFLLNYIFHKRHWFFPKELIISALYTWGIFGGILILKGDINLFQWLVIINYFLLVSANVFLFSNFNIEENGINNFNTLAVSFGKKNTRSFIFTILVIAAIISLFAGFLFDKWIISITLCLINLPLFLITCYPLYFKENAYFGIIADAAFFYPAILFFLETF